MTVRLPRALLALFAAFVVGGTTVAAVPSAAGAAGRSTASAAHGKKPTTKPKKKKKKAKPPKPVTIAPGAVVRYSHVKVSATRTVRVALLRMDVRNPRLRLGAAIPGNAIAAGRQTISTLTRANRAVAGINADFFKGEHPLGGLVVNGVMLKSPRHDWDANLYVRGGRARIGSVNFTGSVTRAARPAPEPDPADPVLLPFPPDDPAPTPQPVPATSRTLTSVNAVRDLGSDRLVYVNSALAAPRFGRSCTVVLASPGDTGSVVTAVVDKVAAIPRRTGRDFALVACGSGPRATWLRTKIVAGDTLSVSMSLAGGTPTTLVSGGQVLVRNGRAFADRDGKTITGRNPETFGCVSRYGTKVVLGTIDGRREGSSGVTLPELQRYLLRLKCWSGIVFDGGGSSTLVGQRWGTRTVRVLNRPSDTTGPRRVTSALLLYRR